jgi:hypothetical protein
MLRRLYADGELAATSVVIVCNGCTDDTAGRARGTLATLEHRATVIDRREPGKAPAIRAAEITLPPGPRLILDADAGCDGATARALLSAVDSHQSEPRSSVAVPRRVIVTDAVRNPLVRAYYRVWQELPWVQAMPSGRAAYALAWELRAPQGRFPDVVADDQWATALVSRAEVAVVEATVDVYPVPTLRELLAVRTRVYRGNRDSVRSRNPGRGSQRPALLQVARRPGNWLGLATFVVVDRMAHRRARRGEGAIWTKR